jgi:MerR family transcriptional regulator/heat shock protein HspR
MEVSREYPIYTIGVVAQLLNLHEQTIRQYERMGLICPCRTLKKTRLYSQEDVERLECIIYLVKTCGVNLSGVQIVITLSAQHPEINELLKSRRIFPQMMGPPAQSAATEDLDHDQDP